MKYSSALVVLVVLSGCSALVNPDPGRLGGSDATVDTDATVARDGGTDVDGDVPIPDGGGTDAPPVCEGGCDDGLDRRARADYRARWRELQAEEAEARRDNDLGRAARARREIDMLTTELAAACGGAHGRRGPSFKERARVNVRNCITGALRTVRRHDESLWRHLINSIKTGTFCSYAPDREVEWEM